jgi:hypothetical protein
VRARYLWLESTTLSLFDVLSRPFCSPPVNRHVYQDLAQAELIQMRKVKLPSLKMEKGEAEFTLVFSGSNKAERADFEQGDPGLRPAEQALIDATFSVSFPDVSSLKIIRRGVLSCGATGCAIALKPIESAGLLMGTGASTQK